MKPITLRNTVLLGAAILALAGCAETVNEGVTDYRKATIDSRSAQGAPTDISKKYSLSDTTDYAGNANIPITMGRRYYVSLLQAFVGPEARVGGRNIFHEHEEIALVLRVHDSNDRDHPGRLVFYSDDAKLGGQFLNFSNLLTIGPAEYRGGVVTIDVDEIHLRGTTQHIKDILHYLAEEPDCRQGAHPASSGRDACDDGPVGASDSAQSQLVGPDPTKRRTWESRERDLFELIDRDGYSTRYTLTLLPAGGVQGLPYPRFEAGNYVLMRHDRRDNAFEWNQLQLDNNTGRLIYAGSHSDENGRIASRDPGSDIDINAQSRKDAFAAAGRRPLWQDRTGDYREQSYVTLQINALAEPQAATISPPRVRSLTQERAARTAAPRGDGRPPVSGTNGDPQPLAHN
jgi:uncharacterized protein YciI